jgi:GxxExxY protein
MPEPALQLDRVARLVVDSAFSVHSILGPGLLESVYEQCLVHELELRDVLVRRQVYLPLAYKGLEIESGLRLDLLVADAIVVEVKALERLLAVHEAQLLTYLKLSNHRLGLLINFNVPLVKDGIRRLIRPA